MSTDRTSAQSASQVAKFVPPLHNGDRLARDEFERRYAATPEDFKAELIEGVVYVQAAISLDHGFASKDLILWLATYELATKGVNSFTNSTIRLDLKNVPQPDVGMFTESSKGGQSRVNANRYLEGPPEFVGEVAVSTASYDLHDKLRAYQRNGVKEYLVWRVLDEEIDWFILRGGKYEQLATSDGVVRSEVYPGLWLDAASLLAGEMTKVLEVLRQGINTPEHAAFVERLKLATPPSAG